MRCALLEPTLVRMVGEFEVATSVWLVELVSHGEASAPLVSRPLTFPISEELPYTSLEYVPELVVEGVGR
jgi:hypothetical protein